MIKRILATTAALASVAALATTANATTTGPTDAPLYVQLQGNVSPVCNAQNNIGSDTQVPITTPLENTSTGLLNTAALNGLKFDLGTVWCNASTSIFVDVTPLTSSTPAGNGFVNRVDYQVSGQLSGVQFFPTVDTAKSTLQTGEVQQTTTTTLFTGDLVITPTLDTGQTSQLVAGAYSSFIIVHLTPSV